MLSHSCSQIVPMETDAWKDVFHLATVTMATKPFPWKQSDSLAKLDLTSTSLFQIKGCTEKSGICTVACDKSVAERRHLAVYQIHSKDNTFIIRCPLKLMVYLLKAKLLAVYIRETTSLAYHAYSSLERTCFIPGCILITSCNPFLGIYTMFGRLYCAKRVYTAKTIFSGVVIKLLIN